MTFLPRLVDRHDSDGEGRKLFKSGQFICAAVLDWLLAKYRGSRCIPEKSATPLLRIAYAHSEIRPFGCVCRQVQSHNLLITVRPQITICASSKPGVFSAGGRGRNRGFGTAGHVGLTSCLSVIQVQSQRRR